MRVSGAISGVILWLALSTLVGSCNCGTPDGDYWGRVADKPDPTHLRWCNSGEPQYLDPALTTSTTGIKLVYAFWDGLTRHDLNGLPEPSIATSWEVSDQMRTFTFHLRKDARWTNGRPITARDFRYHIIRILHPLTGSSNTDPHWKLKNGEPFTSNRIRTLLRDVGPFAKGDIVEIVTPDKKAEDASSKLTYSNARKASKPLELRDFPGFWDWCKEASCRMEEPYRTVPANTTVTIIEVERAADGVEWAYIHWLEGQGIYGWVPMAELDQQPNADFMYTVRAVPRSRIPGVHTALVIGTVEEPAPLVAPGSGAVADEPAAAASEEMIPAPESAEKAPAAAKPAKLAEGNVAARDMMMLPSSVGVRVPDDYTLVLETTNPIPFLIDMTPQRSYRASPREAVSRWPQKWSQPEHFIGSGPYSMTDWEVDDYVGMVKSPTYWDRDSVRIDKITAYSMNDQAASANYYFEGGCDAISNGNLPSSYFPLLDGTKRGTPYKDYTRAPFLGVYFYLVNTKKFPNRHYRRALAMAIDREPIPRVLGGGQIPTTQFMPGTPKSRLSPEDLAACGVKANDPGVASVMISGKLCYVSPPGLAFDVEAAKKELAIAKKELGDAFRTSFTLKFNSGVEGHKLIAEYIQQEWKKHLGLDVTLEVQEWKTFLSDTNHGEFEVARMGSIFNMPDLEAEYLPVLRCGAPDNRPQWCNEEYDALMAKAEATFDRHERLEIVQQIEKLVLEEVPVIPLYIYTQHHLQKPYVRDLAINSSDQVPFEKAWIDADWKKHLTESKPAAKRVEAN